MLYIPTILKSSAAEQTVSAADMLSKRNAAKQTSDRGVPECITAMIRAQLGVSGQKNDSSSLQTFCAHLDGVLQQEIERAAAAASPNVCLPSQAVAMDTDPHYSRHHHLESNLIA